MEITVNINGKDISLRDILEALNDIVKICENKCQKCEKKEDYEKLELIRNIIKKRCNL